MANDGLLKWAQAKTVPKDAPPAAPPGPLAAAQPPQQGSGGGGLALSRAVDLGVGASLPVGHLPGMRVPKGGTSCANCKFLQAGDDGMVRCAEENFGAWNGGPQIPAPVDEYCSDWWQPKPATPAPGGGGALLPSLPKGSPKGPPPGGGEGPPKASPFPPKGGTP